MQERLWVCRCRYDWDNGPDACLLGFGLPKWFCYHSLPLLPRTVRLGMSLIMLEGFPLLDLW